MTLIISARSNDGIVLTADGRSNQTSAGGQHSVKTDTLQKLFPHNSYPLAFAHHGENRLSNRDVADHLRDFMTTLTTGDVESVAMRLLAHFDTIVVPTLSQSTQRKYCGFWIAGLDSQSRFRVFEVDWHKTAEGFERKCIPHGDLLIGGDCATPIRQYLSNPVDSTYDHETLVSRDHAYASRFANKLYDLVMQTSPKTCGGHRHQIWVGNGSPTWIEAPAQPSAGPYGSPAAGSPSGQP